MTGHSRYTAAVLVLAACAPSVDAPRAVEPTSTSPDYRALMEAARIPGLTVGAIENGEIVRIEILGVGSADSAEAATGRTLFEAASLSKPVFATAVLRLAERGELDLDQPLHELLPNERISHDPRSRQLTARLVLSHRTGLPNWGPERLEFIADPGERFGYSGEGYVYLQRVLERVTGWTLDEIARREVFEPLGMMQSRFSWPEGEELQLAMPHDEAGRQQPKTPQRQGNAAASLHTTAEDYARFVVAWMGDEILSRQSIDEALKPVSYVEGDETATLQPPEVASRIAWGLGWGIQLPAEGSNAPPLYWHWGDNGPFKAFVAFDRAGQDGIVVFANSSNGLAIAAPIVAGVLADMEATFEWAGYDRYDEPGFAARLDGVVAEADGRYAEAVAAFREALEADQDNEELARRIEWLTEILDAEQRPIEIPAQVLARYAGTYEERLLVLEDGALYYQRGSGARFRLQPLSETLFILDGLTVFRLEVVTDGGGAPIKLVGHYVNGNTDESPRDTGRPVSEARL